ncbi:abortive phage infection protein [Myceligenerans sp. I2]|uniref:Abortive phage infection protein n=2 Tax=Myceligenerans indicum TaxID=2593663 RepID=A0ABS1LPM9_9MICO|nr:abortive phage infection protein [Myceligenerans indicum]
MKVGRDRDQRLLSRALTAQAVRIVTSVSAEEAAKSVIDGLGDQGIDAIAVVEDPEPHVYVVQGKWSDEGKARGEKGAVREMIAGLRLIDRGNFEPFNERGRPRAEDARRVMTSGPVPVTQVYALMRPDDPGESFGFAITSEEDDFNRSGDVLDHRILVSRDIYASFREDLAPPPIDLEARLWPWYQISVPYTSYHGRVRADQVLAWAENGTNLYRDNIRDPLGRTLINNSMIETLHGEPAKFEYMNNGVTILCDRVVPNRPAVVNPQDEPLVLKLSNASVVNGAQTVRTIADAVAEKSEAASARVNVRIIETEGSAEFAKQVTLATNRQNHVEARDMITLDPVQRAIAEDMRTELGLEYAVRRSELPPPPGSGCSVVEAGTALACARADSQFAAQIAADPDKLWDRGKSSIYDTLFQRQPRAHLLWNAVRVLRRVRLELSHLSSQYSGRGRQVIDHGGHLLVHLTFQNLDAEGNDDPDVDWFAQAAEQIPTVVKKLVPAVASAIDDLFGETSQIRASCSDVGRCRAVAKRVIEGAGSGTAPTDKYRRALPDKKRPPAVKVLIERSALAEGETLTLTPGTGPEQAAMKDWLAADSARSRASWVRHRTKPILWAADGKQYSPSRLIEYMWELAEWDRRPKAVQGTKRWATPSGEVLSELAWRTLRGLYEGDGEADERLI